MKKNVLPLLIIILPIAFIAMFLWFLYGKDDLADELPEINIYTEQEIRFLEEQGFLPDKPKDIIEQDLDSEEESFEFLASKVDIKNNKYQMAFKLENKSSQPRSFYLIPVSSQDQAEFQSIKGIVNQKTNIYIGRDDVKKDSLADLYNTEKHKKELNSELSKAYDDIENNNYTAEPVKITLDSKSALLASSEWNIISSSDLEPVYLLVQGSAGGAKDELIILTVHSYPQQGENWEVEFETRGQADLKIIPNDQATINDDEFTGLYCNGEKRTPQILQGDVIYYPSWQCSRIGKVVHHTKKTDNHILRFEFAGITAFAYNSAAGVKMTINESTMRVEKGIMRVGSLCPGYQSDPSWTKIADTNVRDIDNDYDDTVAKDIYCDDYVCVLYTDGEVPPVCIEDIAADSNLYASIVWSKTDVSSKSWGPLVEIAGGDIGGTHGNINVGNDPDNVNGRNWLARDYTSDVGTYPAMDECKAKGYGWRLPNFLELDSIRDQGKGSAPYAYLPNITSSYRWSSTDEDSSTAWPLSFNTGGSVANPKSLVRGVRCVRGE